MRLETIPRLPGGLLAICLLAGAPAFAAPQQTDAPTQASGAANAQAQAAVALISKQFTVNSMVNVAGTKKPLPKNGTWGVRPAQGAERVAECDAEGAVCREVLYRAGQPEIVCGWTVLFPAQGGAARVVSLTNAAPTYMLRIFSVNDPELPKKLEGPPPTMPPIAQVAHMTGIVLLRVFVDATGKVQHLDVDTTTSPMFTSYALDAVGKWQMEVFKINGTAFPYEEMISVAFH